MAIPSQQIGWSQRAKLLWNISKQLESLTQVAGNVEVGPGPQPTSTTTTTIAPGPTPSFTGTIGVSTITPGNEQFRFTMSARNLGSNMNVTVNWGDNTSDTYSVNNGSPVYPFHNYSSNGAFTVTLTIDNPTLLDTINIDPNFNESGAVVTAFDFGDFNGIAQLVVSNSVLHTADTAGLSTLNILQIQNADLESLALVNSSSLQTLYAQNNNLSVLDLTSATSLSYADLSNNELVGLDIDAAASLTYLDLSNNALAESNVDAILLALVGNNQSNGTLNLTGVANDAPSATGLSAKATLEARGWTVSVSTSSTISTKLMYYYVGYSYNARYAMFINNYYYNNNVNLYDRYYINNFSPKTVYYVGAFGPNTTLFTNPELTEFVIGTCCWNYWMGVFLDATLPETNIPGTIPIYSFSRDTGVILTELGTIANSTYISQNIVNSSNASAYCDNQSAWSNRSALYPPGQNGLSLSGYVFQYIDQYTGDGGGSYSFSPVVREGYDGTTVYSVNSNTGLITAANPCTYVPTWNAFWGASAEAARQASIDSVNQISIKPNNGTSMLNTTEIKPADPNGFYALPSPFYIAYDGVIRAFNNYGSIGAWLSNIPIEPVTVPTTPYQITVLQTSCCSCFNDPSYESQKFTAYSNFVAPGFGVQIYSDSGLTTILQQYTYFTNGSSYFVSYDPWITSFSTC